MRIMCVISGMTSGGAERVMSTLVNHFCINNQVRLVILKNAETDYYINPNVEIKAGNIKHKNMLKAIKFTKNNIEEYMPDIILSFMTKNNIVSLVAKKISKYKCPIIISERANPYYTKGIIAYLRKITYPIANGCVFQTKWAQEYYKNILKCESKIIYNPLSPDFNIKPYTGKKRKVIVCTARLSKEKNQQLLINSFSKIADKYPEYTLEIYGDGPLKDELTSLINKLNMQNKIYLMGRKQNIIECIRDASMFVLPSNSEGMPNSLLEAMALGLPSIATDAPIGGASILISNNHNGILIPTNNRNELINAIEKILNNENFANKISNNGTKVINNFETNKICKEWENYLKIVSKVKE